MVKRLSLTRMTSLAIVVFTGQSTCVTVCTGQTCTGDTNHIMVLSFCRTDASSILPEGIVMTGRAGLRNQRVMTRGTIRYTRASENHIMMLVHRRTRTTTGLPESTVMAEEAAGIRIAGHRWNISRRPVAESTGKVCRPIGVVRVVMLLHPLITGGVTGVTASVKDHGRMTRTAIDSRLNSELMVRVTCSYTCAPGLIIVACRATGYIPGITVAGITGQSWISNCHIVMLLLVGFTRSMAALAVCGRRFNINLNVIMAI